jgi:hypothetical protein
MAVPSGMAYAIDNSLQIFLFQQWWNEVIELPLRRIFIFEELV